MSTAQTAQEPDGRSRNFSVTSFGMSDSTACSGTLMMPLIRAANGSAASLMLIWRRNLAAALCLRLGHYRAAIARVIRRSAIQPFAGSRRVSACTHAADCGEAGTAVIPRAPSAIVALGSTFQRAKAPVAAPFEWVSAWFRVLAKVVPKAERRRHKAWVRHIAADAKGCVAPYITQGYTCPRVRARTSSLQSEAIEMALGRSECAFVACAACGYDISAVVCPECGHCCVQSGSAPKPSRLRGSAWWLVGLVCGQSLSGVVPPLWLLLRYRWTESVHTENFRASWVGLGVGVVTGGLLRFYRPQGSDQLRDMRAMHVSVHIMLLAMSAWLLFSKMW